MWRIGSRRLVILLATTVWGLVGCEKTGNDAEARGESTPHSERAGIGLQAPTSEVHVASTSSALFNATPTAPFNARRSLAVTDVAILDSGFSIDAVFDRMVQQAGVQSTQPGLNLYRELWDTQNPLATAKTPSEGEHCDGQLNGFAYGCRPNEGAQAGTETTPYNGFRPIGLFNRFDLAPADGQNCGEYRIAYGKHSATNVQRAFLIFEAVLPNPRPDLGLDGCRPVAEFWRGLSAIDNVGERAARLRQFYFEGLPGFSPAVHFSNYGANATSAGQIRANLFLNPPMRSDGVQPIGSWLLREFKVRQDGATRRLQIARAPVATNPDASLFATSPVEFQEWLAGEVPTLAIDDVNKFHYRVPEKYNATGSNAGNGTADQNGTQTVPTYNSVSLSNAALHSKLAVALGPINQARPADKPLYPADIIARAQALACNGCHRISSDASLGGGMTFPKSSSDRVSICAPGTKTVDPDAQDPNPPPDPCEDQGIGFVHSTEIQETSPEGGMRFMLSSALTETFLPFRQRELERYLAQPSRFDPAWLSSLILPLQ